jgi:hypothetical protein
VTVIFGEGVDRRQVVSALRKSKIEYHAAP